MCAIYVSDIIHSSPPAIAHHQLALVHGAARFYVQHLGMHASAVVICDDAALASTLTPTPNVHVMGMGEYLSRFWGHLTQLIALHASLAAALAVAKAATATHENDTDGSIGIIHMSHTMAGLRNADTGFVAHQSLAQLQAGVQSEVYVSGPIAVSKYRPRTEAVVRAAQDDKVWHINRHPSHCTV